MDLDLLLFTTEPAYAVEAEAAGVDGFIVDWEGIGKRGRQAGADTEVNADTPEDLSRIRQAVTSPVVCRINPFGPDTEAEVDEAVARGADELLLPMVTSGTEVEAVIDMCAGRARTGILVETVAAVAMAERLASLPISRAYLGLNDLAIQRGSRSLFEAVADGTVERARRAFACPFGFGGLTLPDRGSPVPCRLLMGEMARLRTDFCFLRRSYRTDVPLGYQSSAVEEIRGALRGMSSRDPAAVERDRGELAEAIGAAAAA